MAAVIPTISVYKKLEDHYFDEFVNEVKEVKIDFGTFKKIMMKDGFIVSPLTVKAKWEILEASEIIVSPNPKTCILRLDELDRCYKALCDEIYTYTYTNKNTQGANSYRIIDDEEGN